MTLRKIKIQKVGDSICINYFENNFLTKKYTFIKKKIKKHSWKICLKSQFEYILQENTVDEKTTREAIKLFSKTHYKRKLLSLWNGYIIEYII